MYKLALILGVFIIAGAGCAVNKEDNLSAEDVLLPGEQAEPAATETMDEPTTASWSFPGVLPDETIAGKQIRISTAKGDIVFELFADTAPQTVSNFVYLTEGSYYNGLTFHRREEGFVIQGGDPAGNGSGGPGYTFADELDDEYAYERGVVAMANRGLNTNGSQFFVMLADTPLPKAYTIFGRVLEGMDVVDAIAVGDVMSTVSIEDITAEETEE
ncbi:MAG: peptidylprolyl isomerase [Candidatus Uhrbacteria bacterium]